MVRSPYAVARNDHWTEYIPFKTYLQILGRTVGHPISEEALKRLKLLSSRGGESKVAEPVGVGALAALRPGSGSAGRWQGGG